MSKSNPSDIPSTIKFQNDVVPLQEEYKKALETREHPEKQMLLEYDIVGQHFERQCEIIYERKLKKLYLDIIEYHKTTPMSHIDLMKYKRFNDLVNNAIYRTHTFLKF